MTILIIIELLLSIVLTQGLILALRKGFEIQDDTYRDPNGHHIYYEKSIIEKKLYQTLHPKETLRSFSQLFRLKQRK